MHQPRTIACTALTAMALAAPAPAQSPAGAAIQPGVDAAIEDIGPLGVGRVDLQRDLRTPTGWERVYRIRDADPATGRPALYARKHGAVTAVFPYSVYAATPSGPWPLVPPGTVFYIGDLPPELTSPPAPAPIQSGAIKLDSRIQDHPPPTTSSRPLSIWTDETFRHRRVCALIDQAAAS